MKNRENHLNVLNNRYEDIEMYLNNIPDEEIRETLLFFALEDADEMNSEIKSLEKDVGNLEYDMYCLEKEVEDLGAQIKCLEDDVESLENNLEVSIESSLPWEMAMETFNELKNRIDPWEFEKLIIDKYGNRRRESV